VARLTTASLTGTGNIVGTADYMSPEQVKGAKVDGRSDLFSVGCLVFEMVTGRRPFHADNLMAIFYKITHEEPALELLPAGAEYQALRPILQKAMAKDLALRYASAYEFAVDLREYLKHHAAPAALDGLLEVEPPSGVPSGPTLVVSDELVSRTGNTPVTQRPDLPSTAGRPPTGSPLHTAPGATSPTVRVPAPPTSGRPPTVAPRPPTARVTRAPEVAEASRRMSPLMVGVLAGAVVVGLVIAATVLVRQRPLAEPTAAPATPAASAAASPPVVDASPAAAPSAAPSVLAPSAPPTAVARASAAPEIRRAADGALPSPRAALPRPPADRPLPEVVPSAAPPTHLAQVNGLIGQADAALAGQKYDVAINLYNEALKLDSQNARALQGRSDAVSARALVAAGSTAGAPRAPLRSFLSGKTGATSAEARAARDSPDGFDVKPEDKVQRATQAGALPGKIYFEVQPEQVKPGDSYKVRVFFGNEGNAPIEIASMTVVGRINGRQQSGPVAPLVSKVAPYDRVLLREIHDLWREDTTSWQMEVTVRTDRGETYKNEVIWK
jgi:hypothetical protein